MSLPKEAAAPSPILMRCPHCLSDKKAQRLCPVNDVQHAHIHVGICTACQHSWHSESILTQPSAEKCKCEFPYHGAQPVGMPTICERCEKWQAAEPRRDEREAAMDAIELVIEMADSYKTASQMTLADARNALKYFRASAVPLPQTDDKELAREVAYTLAVESLHPLRRLILTLVLERFCKNHGFSDLAKIAVPQPSASSTETK